MDLMNLGQVSRKTGLKVKQSSRRESNGMENLDEFFLNDSDSNSDENDASGPSRRLTFGKHAGKAEGATKGPDPSPAHNNGRNKDRTNDRDIFMPTSPDTSKRRSGTEFLRSLETLSPIDTTSRVDKNGAALTKKMALSKGKRSTGKSLFSDNNSEQEVEVRTKVRTRSSDVNSNEPDDHFQSPSSAFVASPFLELDMPHESSSASPISHKKTREETRKESYSEPEQEQEQEQELVSQPQRKKPRKSKQTPSPEPSSKPIRRSTRHRIPTLAFWRNEKVIYETKKENGAIVREVKDVVQKPDLSNVGSRSYSNVKKKSSSLPKAASVAANGVDLAEEAEDYSDVAGGEWQKDGTFDAEVLAGPGSDAKVRRVIARGPDKLSFVTRNKGPDNFNMAVLFDKEREFAAAGMLDFPHNGIKLMKKNDKTYFVFFVVKGLVEVTVSDTKFVVSTGCSFEVPMGNVYQLQNIGRGDARLFFVQSKYLTDHPEEDWD